MPIAVTCPSCLARFSVSDKFAGRTGPCPKCKKPITIPDKSQEVVIHAPEESGPKDSKGVSVLKPIKSFDTEPSKMVMIGSIAGGLVVLIGAIVARFMATEPPVLLLMLGALGLAPPLIMGGYGFLRDRELIGYEGRELWARVAIASAIFAATWGVYYFLARYFGNKTLADVDVTTMAILLAGMIVMGTLGSLATFELEMGQAFLHYGLYLVVTFLLCLIVGLPIAAPFADERSAGPGLPTGKPPATAPKK
jgi:hypothetical protein